MKKFFSSKRNVVLTGIGAVLVAVLAVLVGVTVYYGNHALPGASVSGQSVSGMTEAQVTALLEEDLNGEVVEVVGDSTPVTTDLSAVGVNVDIPATVDEVFAPNRGLVTRVVTMFTPRDTTPVVTVDEDKLEEFTSSLEAANASAASNGSVVFDEESKMFVAQPSVAGKELDTSGLADTLVASAKAMSFVPVELQVVDVVPEYDTASAQAAADKANSWLDLDIKAWDRNDRGRYPEREEMAPWITFTPVDGQLEVGLDPEQVQAWVTTVSNDSNVDPVPGVQNVNSRGDILATAEEGNDGYKVNNVQALTDGIIAAVTAGESYEGVMEYDVTERTYTQRLIADGAEGLAYQAAPGEKWIDINLSNYTVTAYEGATPVLQSPMVPGAPATPTVTGEYAVWAKVPTQTMRGQNVDGSKYETPDVPWILYFHGSYATHGAYWRSNFGYDAGEYGSHGCVNMPVDNAQALYNWADVGTKVMSHY